MSEFKVGRVAPQNPTGLKPVQGYNVPARNTIGDFAEKLGIKFNTVKSESELSQLEKKLADSKELAKKFKGTRYEKVYQQYADKLEKQVTALKPQQPAVRKFNQSLNERITAKMDNKPQYGGKTVKSGVGYIAQGADETKELAELNKTIDARSAAKEAVKKSEIEQAWKSYENAPKGNHTYNEVFKYRADEKEAQAAIERGFKPPKTNRAVPFATLIPVDPAQQGAAKVTSVKPKLTPKPSKPVPVTGVIDDGAKAAKPGLLSKIGKFFKGKGGKIGLALAGIAGLVGIAALLFNKCDKDNEPAKSVPSPVPPKPEPKPEPKNKPIHKDAAPEPNYTLKTNYAGMSSYVAAAYGVKEGSAEHKEIMKKMWDVNPGLRNKTLYIGDKVYLPDVKVNDEIMKPDLDKQPKVGRKGHSHLERYQGYKGKAVYGVGAKHDDKANQYHDTDKEKVQAEANKAADEEKAQKAVEDKKAEKAA